MQQAARAVGVDELAKGAAAGAAGGAAACVALYAIDKGLVIALLRALLSLLLPRSWWLAVLA